jgi:hypothetical protein
LGHGYATTAVALVLDFASTALGLASVDAKHHPDNHASGRVLTKSDFTCTSRSPEAITYIKNLGPTRFDVLRRSGYLVVSRTYNWALFGRHVGHMPLHRHDEQHLAEGFARATSCLDRMAVRAESDHLAGVIVAAQARSTT